MLGSHCVQYFRPLVHLFVEVAELAVAQVFVAKQVPLASAVVIAEVVALAREVNPLGMAKLVAHEVKIAFTAKTLRQQADHLVKRHTSVNFKTHLLVLAQSRVYLSVEQPHCNCLITDYRLIMRFRVADALLLLPAIRHAERQMAHIPVLIGSLLE